MRVEPKSLVRRLTSAATKLLESAVSRASEGQYYEVVVEHMLLPMLEPEDGDAALLLKHFGVDRGRLAIQVERALTRMRTGNSGRPVFSETLFKWFEDAWLLASLEYGATRLRTGVLLAQIILESGRYTAELFPELDAIPRDDLKKQLDEVLQPGS